MRVAIIAVLACVAIGAAQVPSTEAKVYATGFVENPGVYLFVADMTVENVIVTAGGIKVNGDAGNIQIRRMVDETRVTLSVTLETAVQPGDEVHIPPIRRLSPFLVYN